MWIFLYIGVVLTIVVFNPFLTGDNYADTTNFYTPKEAAYIVTALGVIALSNFTGLKKIVDFKNKWLGAFLLYFGLCFTWNFFKPLIFGIGEQQSVWVLWALRPFICVVLAYSLMTILVEYGYSTAPWVNLSKIFGYICVGLSVYAILQWLKFDPIFNDQNYGRTFNNGIFSRSQLIVTFMGERTMSSAVIAMLSPYLLIFKGIRYKLFYALAFLALILAESTVAIVAFMAGLFVYLVLKQEKKSLIIFSILAVVALVFLGNYYKTFWHSNGRIGLWQNIIGSCYNSNTMVFGNGFGSFARAFDLDNVNVFPRRITLVLFAHNEFIQLLYEGGIVGVFLFFGYVFNFAIRAFKQVVFAPNIILIGNISALAAVAVLSQGLFPFWFAPTALLTVLIISSTEFFITRRNINV